jgi:hypothetical protein
MTNTTLTSILLKTIPRHNKRRVMGRQIRTPENGASSTKSPGTTLLMLRTKQQYSIEKPQEKYSTP